MRIVFQSRVEAAETQMNQIVTDLFRRHRLIAHHKNKYNHKYKYKFKYQYKYKFKYKNKYRSTK